MTKCSWICLGTSSTKHFFQKKIKLDSLLLFLYSMAAENCYKAIVTYNKHGCIQYSKENIFEECYTSEYYIYKCLDGNKIHCYECSRDGFDYGFIFFLVMISTVAMGVFMALCYRYCFHCSISKGGETYVSVARDSVGESDSGEDV